MELEDLYKFREFESTKFGGNKCQDKNANGSQPATIHGLKINKAANNSSCEKNNLADVNNIVIVLSSKIILIFSYF